MNWPADRVERRPIGALVPNARNARTHSAEQVSQIAASLQEWGWTNPVLVEEGGGIIAGHGRVLAAAELGFAEVPVMVAAGWSDAQIRAYALADNQLALNAGWDLDLLSDELRGLDEWKFDLSLLGFKDLDALLAAGTGLTDPDAVPEPPAHPVSVPGDVWLLGRHRLVCGDSTDPKTVAAALDGVKPHLMVTDPPYGVEYAANWRDISFGGQIGGRATGKVANDAKSDWRDAWALFPGAVAYIWHADRFASSVQLSLEAVGFEIRCQIIWAKSRFAITRGHYHWQHEPCWYAVKGKGHWQGARDQTTLWNITHNKSETGHYAQKPVECMKRPIENNSAPGQAVYDPFVGSGTTIIAAEMTGRACHAIELNPAYVDVAVLRWQAFTGEAATSPDGRSFDALAAERPPVAA
jgi:DNA modification methylase